MENDGQECYSQRDVMGLIIARLYFGVSPDKRTLAWNGRVLKSLTKRGYDWNACARIVEGLALRRDHGQLKPTVQPNEPVSLRWVWAKKFDVNQAALCEDAYYVGQPKPIAKTRGGKPFDLSTLLKGFGRGL
ncbi:MAG TPA: hypothetical protein VIU39_08710 [Anaerolineales bacterium]